MYYYYGPQKANGFIQINMQSSRVTVKLTEIDIYLCLSKYSLRVTQDSWHLYTLHLLHHLDDINTQNWKKSLINA